MIDLDALYAKYSKQHGAQDVVELIEELRVEQKRLDRVERALKQWPGSAGIAAGDEPGFVCFQVSNLYAYEATTVRGAIDYALEQDAETDEGADDE